MSHDHSTMYRWRNMIPDEQIEVMKERRQLRRPLHSPPHFQSDSTTYYLITAACFEHQPIIGQSLSRMKQFEADLVALLTECCDQLFAWTVLPNHYHALVDAGRVRDLTIKLGRLHGRNSYRWNTEEGASGRKCWFNSAETAMKSEGHFYASINYVLHNAVRHGYVKKWSDWPFCSAEPYLASIGYEKAKEIWLRFPLFDYGKDWDPPDL